MEQAVAPANFRLNTCRAEQRLWTVEGGVELREESLMTLSEQELPESHEVRMRAIMSPTLAVQFAIKALLLVSFRTESL